MVQQQAVIEVGGQAVTVFNVHPPVPYFYGANSELRSQVIGRILKRAALAPGEVLLIGDFNMGDASEDYWRVRANYGDTFKAVGYGFGLSFPDWSWRDHPMRVMPPLSRLDYIFYSPGFVPLLAWTSHISGGSDHRPIYAELRLES
jgi:endonuclease/exonuclease/phosphatase (EEP) superfamily protein YafD